MMNQSDWEALVQAFREEEPFWENEYADESEFKNLNLYKWLECDGAQPSERMKKELALHGYDVFPVERDSFGWLIGGIREMLINEKKVITFG